MGPNAFASACAGGCVSLPCVQMSAEQAQPLCHTNWWPPRSAAVRQLLDPLAPPYPPGPQVGGGGGGAGARGARQQQAAAEVVEVLGMAEAFMRLQERPEGGGEAAAAAAAGRKRRRWQALGGGGGGAAAGGGDASGGCVSGEEGDSEEETSEEDRWVRNPKRRKAAQRLDEEQEEEEEDGDEDGGLGVPAPPGLAALAPRLLQNRQTQLLGRFFGPLPPPAKPSPRGLHAAPPAPGALLLAPGAGAARAAREEVAAVPLHLGLAPLRSAAWPKLGCGQCSACREGPTDPPQPCLRVAAAVPLPSPAGPLAAPPPQGAPQGGNEAGGVEEEEEEQEGLGGRRGGGQVAGGGSDADVEDGDGSARGAGGRRPRRGRLRARGASAASRAQRRVQSEHRRQLEAQARVLGHHEGVLDAGRVAARGAGPAAAAGGLWRAAALGAAASVPRVGGRMAEALQQRQQQDGAVVVRGGELRAWEEGAAAARALGLPAAMLQVRAFAFCVSQALRYRRAGTLERGERFSLRFKAL